MIDDMIKLLLNIKGKHILPNISSNEENHDGSPLVLKKIPFDQASINIASMGTTKVRKYYYATVFLFFIYFTYLLKYIFNLIKL